jgi:hypothetical protein
MSIQTEPPTNINPYSFHQQQGRYVLSRGFSQNTAFCSIAMKEISGERQEKLKQNGGKLGWFERLFWKAVKTGDETYILLNINSVKKRLLFSENRTTLQSFLSNKEAETSHLETALTQVRTNLKTVITSVLRIEDDTSEDVIQRLNQARIELRKIQKTMQVLQKIDTPNRPKEARFLNRRKYGLTRSLILSAVGEVFILLNRRKKKRDRCIGKGSFKKVKIAINIKTAEEAAYLSIQNDTSIQSARAEFNRNVRLAELGCSKLANVVKGSFVNRGHKAAFLMPKAAGNLLQLLESGGLNAGQKHDIAVQMIEAVRQLHSCGCCHRDIKPENFLYFVDAEDQIKIGISDLGFSSPASEFKRCGTPHYMAPEMTRYKSGEDVDPLVSQRVDVWSTGVSLLELFIDGKLSKTFIDSLKKEGISKKTLKTLFPGNSEQNRSLRRAIYYSLRPNPEERCVFVLPPSPQSTANGQQ